MPSKIVQTSILYLFILAVSPAQIFAQSTTLDVDMATGMRRDKLDWNIAGNINGTNPNILSELTWTDLEIYQLNSSGRLLIKGDTARIGGLVRGLANYGVITAGKNQDSDYNSDNRQDEFSRSNNSAGDGNVWDLSLGGGVVFFMLDQKLAIAPMAGYSYHKQNLQMNDGMQTIPNAGAFPGLDSSYDAEWKGLWGGVDISVSPAETTKVYATLELHSGDYEGEADWNLRPDFQHPVSFRHDSDDAVGIKLNLGVKDGGKRVKFKLDLFYQRWQAEDGTDTTYFSDGTVLQTKLNEVNWQSYGMNAGVLVSF